MKIKLWGVRGSVPKPLTENDIRGKLKRALMLATPGDIASEDSIDKFINNLPHSVRGTYGGNTTTIEIRTKENELIIIDAGTGISHPG